MYDEIAYNPKQLKQYRAGKVMKATQGTANPVQVNEQLKRKLAP